MNSPSLASFQTNSHMLFMEQDIKGTVFNVSEGPFTFSQYRTYEGRDFIVCEVISIAREFKKD